MVDIDNEKALKWLRNGARPSERVEKLLKISGAWAEFTGGVSTLDDLNAASTENT